ncbi:ammosamide/lymphostin RiPP family protein [Actinosynnema sp. NPDC059797]
MAEDKIVAEEVVDELDVLDDLDDIEFTLDEIENKIAPLALA